MIQPHATADRRRYFKEVRFRQIRALVELSRRGTFAATAQALGLSTPSVWQQIRALEDEFGVPLVIVKGRQVKLTDDGQAFIELARPLVEGFDSLSRSFADRQGLVERSLTVTAPAPLLARELREPVLQYRRRLPAVRLKLLDRPSALARELLEEGQADIAVIGIPGETPALPQFRIYPLTSFDFRLICRQDHPLASARRITLRSIIEQPLILPFEESSSRKRVEDVFAKAGLGEKLNVTLTAGSLSLIMTYVAMGLGVSVVSASPSLEPPQPAAGEQPIVFRELTHLFGTDEILLLQRRGHHEIPHVRIFRELVCTALQA